MPVRTLYMILLCTLLISLFTVEDIKSITPTKSVESQTVCTPLTTGNSIRIESIAPALDIRAGSPVVKVLLNEEIEGSLLVDEDRIRELGLKVWLKNIEDRTTDGQIISTDSILLTPYQASYRVVKLLCERPPLNGVWNVSIPAGYFEIRPGFEEVEKIDIPEEDLSNFRVAGAWHKQGESWKGRGLFTMHDDDGMDGYIPSSKPSDGITIGYFSIMYPLLESLGLRGCVSLEGRRAGWTAGGDNDNVRILRRLQDEKGWEVQSHSMLCLGEVLRNWAVDDLDSSLARRLLKDGENFGPFSSQSISVYDKTSGKQYMPFEDRSGWIEADSIRIRPYIGDYNSRKSIMYNYGFSVDYHWGEWFRKAEHAGIRGRSWVTHNTSSCHANVPIINAICPNGFADMAELEINYPPLLSIACRMMLEGQTIKGYKGDDGDNSYNKSHYEYFKRRIDEAASKGGWIVMGMHAYRNCWLNYKRGELVSEGGSYPDEWVYPMSGADPLKDPLTPPQRLGIVDWSEWYPCPGTRLRMAWDLLRYAKERGLIHVTSSEGFDLIGNKINLGYYNRGIAIGQDKVGLVDTKEFYPHYVVGANGEISYYNTLTTEALQEDICIGRGNWYDPFKQNAPIYFNMDGQCIPGLSSSGITLIHRIGGTKKVIR